MIHFRNCPEPFAPGVVEHWQVEYYEDDHLGYGGGHSQFPVGIGFVVVVESAAMLQFIFVADQWRRRGIGLEIVEAAKQRWPNIHATGPMDDRSRYLLTKARIDFESDE